MTSFRYIFLITLSFLIIQIGLYLLGSLMNVKITKGQLQLGLTIFVLSMGLLGFSYEFFDGSSVDIVRHYEIIENMRSLGMDYIKYDANYKNLYVINYFMYLVSLTPYNSLFISIPIVIDLSIMSYILVDRYKETDDIDLSEIFLIIMCFMAVFSTKYMFLAVRNNLAIAICSLALYLDYIKGKKRVIALILYIVSMFIHPFSLIIVFIRFCLLLNKKCSIIWICILCIYPISILVCQNIYPTNNVYFNDIISSLLRYQDHFSFINVIKTADGASLLMLFSFILVMIFLLYTSIKQRNATIFIDNDLVVKTEDVKITKYLFMISLVLLGLLSNYLLAERFLMVCSFGLLFYLPKVISKDNLGWWKAALILISLYAIFWDIFFIGINYTGYNPLAGIGQYF